MATVKIRRVGNSNVVSLPRSLERFGFTEGTVIALVPTRNGELILIPAERMDDYIDALGQRIVEENREALAALAAHDRQEGAGDVGEFSAHERTASRARHGQEGE